jgi:hypothetical protein
MRKARKNKHFGIKTHEQKNMLDHTVQRAVERTQLETQDILCIMARIKKGDYIFEPFNQNSNSQRPIRYVKYGDKVIKVVYDLQKKMTRTILPMNSRDYFLLNVVDAVRSSKAKVIKEYTSRRKLYEIIYDGKVVTCIYESKRKRMQIIRIGEKIYFDENKMPA